MKKESIFFHPIDGSGALAISWSSGPKGDAVEAKKGSGVGFFSEKGDLLCVIFDEVLAEKDHQILEFGHARVEITVKDCQVWYKTTRPRAALVSPKKRLHSQKNRSRLKAKSHN